MTISFRLARRVCACAVSAVVLCVGVACGDGGSVHSRVEEDSPAWDCRTMGNHLCGSDFAYWDEPNVAMPSGYEHMFGQLSRVPVGAVNVRVVGVAR